MDGTGWKWCVIATVHGENTVELTIEAEGRVLVSGSARLTPLQVITRAMAELANFDEGDSVTVVVHGRALPMSTWTGSSAYTALYWLATALSKACCGYEAGAAVGQVLAQRPPRRSTRASRALN